ncbi:MAG: site-specific DNA-methyltransferase [Promethearchaeota archaeon]
MVKLNWKNKELVNVAKRQIYQKLEEFQEVETYILPSIIENEKNNNLWKNLLIFGDNKLILSSLLRDYREKIKLIYIDPPFATGGDFYYKLYIGENNETYNAIAYTDIWREGLESYLTFMFERLCLMKDLLSNDGSIYIHLDWHVSHYIKIIMDEIFEKDNFRNEIIWAYPAASAQTRRFYIRSFDAILFYTKSDDYTFNDDPDIYMEFSDRVKFALKKDEKGTYYFRGGSHNGKKLSQKVYVTKKGIFPRDVWTDIPYIRANTLEYQGFSTQKPERLLKRIVLASSNKDDLIADFFCGSGTLIAVAEKLGRYWIGSDIAYHAIHMTRKRLLDLSNSNDLKNWKKKYGKIARPFKILKIGNNKSDIQIPLDFISKEAKDYNSLKIIEPPSFKVEVRKKQNEVSIELNQYFNPNLNLLIKDLKDKLINWQDWIDYWAIDFNSQGNLFKSMWFSYRTPKQRELKLTSDSYRYKKPGKYQISIKTVDIFEFETIQNYNIEII